MILPQWGVSFEVTLPMLEAMEKLVAPLIKQYDELLERAGEIDSEVIDKEIEKQKHQEIVEKRKTVVNGIRSTQKWLVEKNSISLELAKDFVRSSAWWYLHPSGSPVRAKKHADNIYKSNHGWVLDFGANTFLVGKAIERCARELNSYFKKAIDGTPFTFEELTSKLILHIRGAVANYGGNEYEAHYPLTGQDMMFGVQSINVKNGAKFLIDRSKIKKILKIT